jgi:hypothetical protein
MITKKQKENIIGAFLIFVCAVALTIIIVSFQDIFHKDNFTITKTECNNIENKDMYSGCFSGCTEGFVYFQRFNISLVELIEFDRKCFDYCDNLSIEEKCSTEEVDSIFFSNNLYEDFGKKFNNIKVEIVDGGYLLNKKDLTKEWLSENCNCMDVCEDLSCSNRDNCKYYKCGEDYEVN